MGTGAHFIFNDTNLEYNSFGYLCSTKKPLGLTISNISFKKYGIVSAGSKPQSNNNYSYYIKYEICMHTFKSLNH